MENSENPQFTIESKEKEPEILRRYYFFRHDKPVYSEDLAHLMEQSGYSPTEYSSAKFEEKQTVSKSDAKYHPTAKQMGKFLRRDSVQGFEQKKNIGERARFEGVVERPSERKNIKSIAGILKQEKISPLVFVGPRTRHGFSGEALVESLKEEGVSVNEKNITVADKLTDINKHWIKIFDLAKELNLKNPWQLLLDSSYEEKLKEKGIETFEEISERIKNFLAVLEREYENEKSEKSIFNKGSSVSINITSDFDQLALLKALGIEQIKEKPIMDFRPGLGSYIEIEVLANDTANIYYQSSDEEAPELLATVDNFHRKIEDKN